LSLWNAVSVAAPYNISQPACTITLRSTLPATAFNFGLFSSPRMVDNVPYPLANIGSPALPLRTTAWRALRFHGDDAGEPLLLAVQDICLVWRRRLALSLHHSPAILGRDGRPSHYSFALFTKYRADGVYRSVPRVVLWFDAWDMAVSLLARRTFATAVGLRCQAWMGDGGLRCSRFWFADALAFHGLAAGTPQHCFNAVHY